MTDGQDPGLRASIRSWYDRVTQAPNVRTWVRQNPITSTAAIVLFALVVWVFAPGFSVSIMSSTVDRQLSSLTAEVADLTAQLAQAKLKSAEDAQAAEEASHRAAALIAANATAAADLSREKIEHGDTFLRLMTLQEFNEEFERPAGQLAFYAWLVDAVEKWIGRDEERGSFINAVRSVLSQKFGNDATSVKAKLFGSLTQSLDSFRAQVAWFLPALRAMNPGHLFDELAEYRPLVDANVDWRAINQDRVQWTNKCSYEWARTENAQTCDAVKKRFQTTFNFEPNDDAWERVRWINFAVRRFGPKASDNAAFIAAVRLIMVDIFGPAPVTPAPATPSKS